jgi:hypothetical protein
MKRSKDIGHMAPNGGTPTPCAQLNERMGSAAR